VGRPPIRGESRGYPLPPSAAFLETTSTTDGPWGGGEGGVWSDPPLDNGREVRWSAVPLVVPLMVGGRWAVVLLVTGGC